MIRRRARSAEDYFREITRVYVRPIAEEIRNLLISRHVFWEVQAIIDKNRELHSEGLFNNWLATNYGVALAVGIRRQMDGSSTSISLAYVLKLFACKPELILRERFVSLYPTPRMQKFADRTFSELAGPGPHIDPNVPFSDLNVLENDFRPLRRFVNKRLAHYDIRGNYDTRSVATRGVVRRRPKFGELDSFLDKVADTFAKYFLLCLAQDRHFFEPTIVASATIIRYSVA